MTRELPPGWEWASVEDVCDVILGQSPPGSSYNQVGRGVPFLQGKAEFGDTIPTIKKWTTEPKKFAQGGSVLVSVRAPVGPTNVAPFECAIGRGLASLKPKVEMSTSYLLWAMRHSEGELLLQATGSTFEAITGKQLRSHVLPIAPLSQQRRIVAAIEEHFSRIEAVDSAVESAQRKLGAFRRSSFQDLFDRPDWPWMTLGQIAEVKGGVTKDSKNQGNPAFVEVPYLRVANVQRGFLDLEEVTTIRVKPEKALSLELKPGDILFNEGGDRDKLGRGWVWEGQVEGCIHQNHVFRARLTGEAFDPYFVSMHGNTWGQRWFEAHGKQTTNLASLNLTTLKSFPVPSPSLSEQREVVEQLRAVMEMEDSLQADLNQAKRHLATLRRSILAAAFSGQLVPQDPNDEPASALLRRIRVPHASKGN